MNKTVVGAILAVATAIFSSTLHGAEITVGGSGTVKAKADLVKMSFDVTSLNRDLDDGFAELKAKNAALSEALKAAGATAEEIRVSTISLSQQYNYGKIRTFEGYRQSCSFTLTFPLDMVRVQTFYKAIVGTKCGEEISVQFLIKDDSAFRAEAKKLAVRDARATAELLAEAAGVTLGKVESIVYHAGSVRPLRQNGNFRKLAYAPEPGDGLSMASDEVGDILISEEVGIIWTIE